MTNATIQRLHRLQVGYSKHYVEQCEKLSNKSMEVMPKIILRAEQERTYLNMGRVRYYLRMAQLD